jgi:hypothetical protein
MNTIKRYLTPILALVAMVTVLGLRLAYAQTAEPPPPPTMDQIIEGVMALGGTYLAAYLVNLLRVKFGMIQGSVFVGILVPVLGLGISYLVNFVSGGTGSWILNFLASLGAVWISQVQAQLNLKTGPAQYLVGSSK